MARFFVVDGRKQPDPDPTMKDGKYVTSVDEIKDKFAVFFPEVANAELKTTKDGEDTIYEFTKRVGTKGKGGATEEAIGQLIFEGNEDWGVIKSALTKRVVAARVWTKDARPIVTAVNAYDSHLALIRAFAEEPCACASLLGELAKSKKHVASCIVGMAETALLIARSHAAS